MVFLKKTIDVTCLYKFKFHLMRIHATFDYFNVTNQFMIFVLAF